MHILLIGVCLSLASALLLNVQLYRFDRYIKSHHPELWRQHGFGNTNVNIAVRLMRLRKFAHEYESTDTALNRQFALNRFTYRLGYVGVAVVLFGVVTMLV